MANYSKDSNQLIESNTAYPDSLEQNMLNGSGDTSAYFRTTSSLHYSIGVGGDVSSVGGGIAASLSDLGGSLLSLSAVIPDPNHHNPHHHHHLPHLPHLHHNSSEPKVNTNHLITHDSFSPSSNWSIDGNSQYNNSSINNNQYIQPEPMSNYTESYYTSIRQFDSPTSQSSSSVISGNAKLQSVNNYPHHHHHAIHHPYSQHQSQYMMNPQHQQLHNSNVVTYEQNSQRLIKD
ncbi:unnamed protein product, partial [Trichobilharzia regenti]